MTKKQAGTIRRQKHLMIQHAERGKALILAANAISQQACLAPDDSASERRVSRIMYQVSKRLLREAKGAEKLSQWFAQRHKAATRLFRRAA